MRERLSYANVMATIAVFLALGGTSYALTLPRNSVGKGELRPDSVGRSELRRNAVGSSEIVDRSVGFRDISTNARNALRGQVGPRGPAGVALFASINAAGEVIRGNATSLTSPEPGARHVRFGRQVSDCVATATLVGTIAMPGAGVRVELGDGEGVLVRTSGSSGNPAYLPFNLIVAC
jgi:hypothetical protein